MNLKTAKQYENTHNSHKTNQTEEVGEHVMEDAQALLTATAHVAEEKVIEARKTAHDGHRKRQGNLAQCSGKGHCRSESHGSSHPR